MTLGRTSSGAIKIKTDTEGGGLRAVECACCEEVCYGQCYYVKVSSSISSILNNITSASQCTLLGQNPTHFEEDGGSFSAGWAPEEPPWDYLYAACFYIKGSSCFAMSYVNSVSEHTPLQVSTGAGYCEHPFLTPNATNFTINGIAFPAYYYHPYFEHTPPLSQAEFVFT